MAVRHLILEGKVPNLESEGFSITSAPDARYNCLAWAVGDTRHWWEPDSGEQYFWPPGAQRGDYTLASYVDALVGIGWERCAQSDDAAGFERLVLYADSAGEFTHAAKRIGDDTWASKMGKLEDIEHRSLEAVEGPLYGSAQAFLRRRLPETYG